jgi:hypothetical protein
VPALAASVVINALIVGFMLLRPTAPIDEFAGVRDSSVWSPLLEDGRTIFVVVGDYYIFGETDESMEVKRLVREFDINSPQDLDMRMKTEPDFADRYMDLELAYLPTATAFALRDVMPVLAPVNRRVRIVTMSQLNPAVIKSADIVYIGYLSGLGMLGDIVFAGSRLQVGDSFDEIVDRSTKQRYISQAAGAPLRGDRKFHDYGYFATFLGPSGNRIVVIAGTRDVAAMHMAETLTDATKVQSLIAKAGSAPSFEALYEVYGMDKLNLDGKLLLTSPIDSNNIWRGEPSSTHAGLPGMAQEELHEGATAAP